MTLPAREPATAKAQKGPKGGKKRRRASQTVKRQAPPQGAAQARLVCGDCVWEKPDTTLVLVTRRGATVSIPPNWYYGTGATRRDIMLALEAAGSRES